LFTYYITHTNSCQGNSIFGRTLRCFAYSLLYSELDFYYINVNLSDYRFIFQHDAKEHEIQRAATGDLRPLLTTTSTPAYHKKTYGSGIITAFARVGELSADKTQGQIQDERDIRIPKKNKKASKLKRKWDSELSGNHKI
jgi:hypothetical protein